MKRRICYRRRRGLDRDNLGRFHRLRPPGTRFTSMNRFRTACVGLYDTIGLLTAHRRSGRMTIEQWEKVNGFAEQGDKVCQDTTIEDFDAALAKVQDARAGIADTLKEDGTNV